MATATLDEYQAFNEHLAALAAAGVPLDLDLGAPHEGPTKTLERINATVARRVKRGESLTQALEDDDRDLPPSYRSLVQVGLHEGDLAAGLDESSEVAESALESRTRLASGFVYPLVVCALAYVGLLVLCLYFEPSLASLYRDVQLEPSSSLRVLEVLRTSLPYWSVIVPLVLVAIAVWLFRSRRRPAVGDATSGLLGWLPGMSKSLFQERCARFATMLAELLNDGVPLGQSLKIAGDGCGDTGLRGNAMRLAQAIDAGQLPADDSATAEQFPPFMRWAIWHSEEMTGRVRALEIAARMYRETAQRRAARFRTVAPVVLLVFVGGTATLLYGLALFLPMVQLLYGLAR